MSIIEAVWRPDLVEEDSSSATPAVATAAAAVPAATEVEAPTSDALDEQLKIEEQTSEGQETK